MALTDHINNQEALYTFLGGNDPAKWTNIAKALNRGTTPYEIKTGLPFEPPPYDASRITFGGIEGEGRVVPAQALASPTSTMAFTHGVPRRVLANAVQTDLYMTFALEEWWLKDSLAIYMEWTNDHTATGNARWQFELKEIDIGTERTDQGGIVASKTITVGSPPANGGTTTTAVFSKIAGDTISFTPGPFASFYVCRVSRLAGDALDTVEGPLGVVELSYVRGN